MNKQVVISLCYAFLLNRKRLFSLLSPKVVRIYQYNSCLSLALTAKRYLLQELRRTDPPYFQILPSKYSRILFRSTLETHRIACNTYFLRESLDCTSQQIAPISYFCRFIKPILLEHRNKFVFDNI